MDTKNKQTSLLDRWKNSDKREASLSTIPKAPEGTPIPLSSGQRRLWFLQQLFPKNTFYNSSAHLTLGGKLNTDFLKESLAHIFKYNEILRSSYPLTGGLPMLHIHQDLPIVIKEVDFSDLSDNEIQIKSDAYIATQAAASFDLSKPPLIKVSLIKLDPIKHVLFLTMHHIIIDIWSVGLLKEQIARNYSLLCRGEELEIRGSEIQYSDFAYWHHKKPSDESQLDYWKQKLSGELPILDLQKDRKHPVQPSFQGRHLTEHLPKELSGKVLDLAKTMEVTPFVLLFSALYVLLYRYSGQNDIIVGTPISIRNEKSLEELIGFFIDTIVLRSTINPEESFAEFVTRVRQNTLEAFSNKDVPFDELVKELKLDRTLSTNPLFQVMFVYHSEPKAVSFQEEIQLYERLVFDSGVSKFDLTLYVAEEQGNLAATFEYATDLFDEPTILRFHEHLKLILEAVTTDPQCKIKEVPMLTSEEKQFFLQDTGIPAGPFSNFKGIHEIIFDRTQENPTSTAVVCGEDSMTYGELSKRALALVPTILEQTDGDNKIVALGADRTIEMIIGLLAILKAGCAYLPIDPDYPTQRVEYMLEDAQVNVMLARNSLKSSFQGFKGAMIAIDADHPEIDPSRIRFPEPSEDHLAYVIYTSGSTGKPKGVLISHKNIINSTEGRLTYYDNNPSVFLLMSSLAFDSSKAGIFWTLCTGGTLVVSAKHAEQDIDGLAKTIEKHGVSHTLMLPTLYNLLLDYREGNRLKSLTTVMVAGEACSPVLAKKHFSILPHTDIYNEYGPTEGTVWCLAHKIGIENSYGSIPIGKPVSNARVYLLNEDHTLAPYGVIGEICIGGPGLSKRYLNRPDLTQAAYFEASFRELGEEKLYKTGDLGRYDQDGNIEFLGRTDEQVKIRGHRIELDEIENTLSSHEMISEAIVLVEEVGSANSKRLIAFIITRREFDSVQVKSDLKSGLPDYMIPAALVPLKEFPTLTNGKVDKKALLIADRPAAQTDLEKEDTPRTRNEGKLVEIWKEVLGLSSIGINDNFFDIGGDSISSIQILTRAREEGVILSPNQIFEYQTIAELGNFIAKNKGKKEKWDYLVPFRKEGNKKPLFCLHAGGGHVFFYQGLVDFIDADRPLYALQASGVYGKQHMHKTIAEMADDYIKAIKAVQETGPYNVLVYCFSATVGHEIAIQLKKSNDECNLIVMDTMAKPWTLNTPERLKIRLIGFYKRLLNKPFYTLNHMVSIRLNNLMRQTYKVLGNEEQKTLEELRSNLEKLSVTYDWKPFDGKISLILTKKPHESLNKETVNSWKEFASGGIRVLHTKGNHSFVFQNENLPHVAEKIELCFPD